MGKQDIVDECIAAEEIGDYRRARRSYRGGMMSPAFERYRREFDVKVKKFKEKINDARAKAASISEEIDKVTNSKQLTIDIRNMEKMIEGETKCFVEARKEKASLLAKKSEEREEINKRIEEADNKKKKFKERSVQEIDKKLQDLELKMDRGEIRVSEESGVIQDISRLKRDRAKIKEIESEISRTKQGCGESMESINSRLDEISKVIGEKQAVLNDLNSKKKALIMKREAAQQGVDDLFKRHSKASKDASEFEMLKKKLHNEFSEKKRENDIWVQTEEIKIKKRDEINGIKREIDALSENVAKLKVTSSDIVTQKCLSIRNYLHTSVVGSNVSEHPKTNPPSNPIKQKEDAVSNKYAIKGSIDRKSSKESRKMNNNSVISLPLDKIALFKDLGVNIPMCLSDIPQVIEALDVLEKKMVKKRDEELKELESDRCSIQKKIDEKKRLIDNLESEYKELENGVSKKSSSGSEDPVLNAQTEGKDENDVSMDSNKPLNAGDSKSEK